MNDTDSERLIRVEANVTELQARLAHDEQTRQELLAASVEIVPTLAKRQQQLESGMAAAASALANHPQMEAARERGITPKFNTLLLRQQELERQFAELREFFVSLSENQQRMAERLEALDQLVRGLRGGPEAA